MANATAARYRSLVLTGLFAAIIIVMAFTPLGYLPLPFIKMTLIHIPVILGSVLLGIKRGAFLGFLFGATSLITNTLTPAITSFTFTPLYPLPGTTEGTPVSLIVCFVPRILVGIVPFLVYRLMQRLPFVKKSGHPLSLAVAGIAGSLTNTVGVMGLIFLLFRDAYAAAKAIEPDLVLSVIGGIVATNGVIEAIGAAVLVSLIGTVLMRVTKGASLK